MEKSFGSIDAVFELNLADASNVFMDVRLFVSSIEKNMPGNEETLYMVISSSVDAVELEKK